MKFVRSALNWVIGIIFLLAGLHLSKEFLVSGLSLILISLLVIPPVGRIISLTTRKELSQHSRRLAIILLLVVFGVSAVASQVTNDRKLRSLNAEERVKAEYTLSQTRHADFFGLVTWKHSDYVENNGAGLCVICHSLKAGGQVHFGPRCAECHRDLQAFEESIQPRQRKTAVNN